MADSETTVETAESIFESMRNDRLVRIFIGDDDSKPLLIQQSTICAASPFFKAAFTGANYEEAKSGILRLPEDDLQAWQIFIYWLLKNKIPQGSDLAVIKAWTLGDKYKIPQLQDDVMFAMMEEFDYFEERSMRNITHAFSYCPQGSLMRKFLADQVVLIVKHEQHAGWGSEVVQALCEDPGNHKDLLDAVARAGQEDLSNWEEKGNGEGKPFFFEYMVGEGPNAVEFHGWLNLTNGWMRF
ncbi:hypothetical protein PRZ48_000173 [Zasmidium cellare]|uniref:BTB domain-containing protein n=1 Tax=Zasmidium cellare TaxID=395010 RepID=A0ABR0EZ65_ZASCE|nr:hypothetical protein PRZ48_000173 [Zasmidium cellare]